MISPTVGRVVWFHEAKSSAVSPNLQGTLAAIVAFVYSDRLVNLCVFDAYGQPHSRTSVPLVQPGDTVPTSGFYCEWMPYQIQTAAAQAK